MKPTWKENGSIKEKTSKIKAKSQAWQKDLETTGFWNTLSKWASLGRVN